MQNTSVLCFLHHLLPTSTHWGLCYGGNSLKEEVQSLFPSATRTISFLEDYQKDGNPPACPGCTPGTLSEWAWLKHIPWGLNHLCWLLSLWGYGSTLRLSYMSELLGLRLIPAKLERKLISAHLYSWWGKWRWTEKIVPGFLPQLRLLHINFNVQCLHQCTYSLDLCVHLLLHLLSLLILYTHILYI